MSDIEEILNEDNIKRDIDELCADIKDFGKWNLSTCFGERLMVKSKPDFMVIILP